MASRIMHLALAEGILSRRELADREGFVAGSLLPDAPRPLGQGRASHFQAGFMAWGREMRTYDTGAFFGLFAPAMAAEGLYLGYYLHLVQDIAFRRFLYVDHDLHCRDKEELLALYQDYGMLNRLLIDRYGLTCPEVDAGQLGDTELCHMFCLDAETLFRDLREDFARKMPGEPKRFTMGLAEEYLDKALELCLKELDALRTGKEALDPWTMAWAAK